MRKVSGEAISAAIARLCEDANLRLGADVLRAVERAREAEESPRGREVLHQILQNARVAQTEGLPLCQDTGVAVVFIDIGQEVIVTGQALEEAVNEGVRKGYAEGYLRKSIVNDPVERKNTGDNTPAVLHVRIVPGERVKIAVMAKGGGCENMSRIAMLTPAEGRDGVVEMVVDTIRDAGANPCPPVIVGVGIGGTFEQCAILAKRALLRPVGQPHPDGAVAELEQDMLRRINALGIGPQGFGGRTTALAVHVETHPCHIASLPVAVNVECHSHRHKSIVL